MKFEISELALCSRYSFFDAGIVRVPDAVSNCPRDLSRFVSS